MFFIVRYAMEIHIVHYKKEYGNYENAQNYIDGLCVVGFFGEVIDINIIPILYYENLNTYLIFVT